MLVGNREVAESNCGPGSFRLSIIGQYQQSKLEFVYFCLSLDVYKFWSVLSLDSRYLYTWILDPIICIASFFLSGLPDLPRGFFVLVPTYCRSPAANNP